MGNFPGPAQKLSSLGHMIVNPFTLSLHSPHSRPFVSGLSQVMEIPSDPGSQEYMANYPEFSKIEVSINLYLDQPNPTA